MISVALQGRRGGFDFAVDLTIPSRGTTALLGPSGSGKTSILRALAGLDRHRGTIRFDDDVWQDATTFVPAHRRGVGWVPQGSGLLPHLSVGANLDYAMRLAPAGRLKRDDVVRRTGIQSLLSRSPVSLSGGEAQRASIARGLLGQPRLLLMDEPLSGLDIIARNSLVEDLRDLFAGLTIPVIYVTHDPGEAEKLSGLIVQPVFNDASPLWVYSTGAFDRFDMKS